MTEEFLQYVWKNRLFRNEKLFTDEGEEIVIISPGVINVDSGPDFINAKIKIGNTLWAGNVEIHLKSSDWYTHKHEQNKMYDNVILHVVWEKDKTIYRNTGELIPCLQLKGLIYENIFERYTFIQKSQKVIPCSESISRVPNTVVSSMIESSAVERLEKKTEEIFKLLALTQNDWEQVLFQITVKYFGSNVNSHAFELLAKSINFKTLIKHSYSQLSVEALLFGQAGFLEKEFKDEYPSSLKKEYDYLRKKLSLEPIPHHVWKLSKIRPYNFPTIRIAQLALFVTLNSRLFSNLIESNFVYDFYRMFEMEKINEYWDNHYVFDKISSQKMTKKIGNQLIDVIVINSFIPILFSYGKYYNNELYCEKALKYLENIKSEKNSIIQTWKRHGIIPQNAFESQGLIELKNSCCDKKLCLNCKIGHYILTS